jgi:hypothetical protein
VTQEIFAKSFQNFFVSTVKYHLAKQSLPLKALLLIGNCSAHTRNLTSDDGTVPFAMTQCDITTITFEMVRWYHHHLLSALVQTQELQRQERPVPFQTRKTFPNWYLTCN